MSALLVGGRALVPAVGNLGGRWGAGGASAGWAMELCRENGMRRTDRATESPICPWQAQAPASKKEAKLRHRRITSFPERPPGLSQLGGGWRRRTAGDLLELCWWCVIHLTNERNCRVAAAWILQGHLQSSLVRFSKRFARQLRRSSKHRNHHPNFAVAERLLLEVVNYSMQSFVIDSRDSVQWDSVPAKHLVPRDWVHFTLQLTSLHLTFLYQAHSFYVLNAPFRVH